MKLVVVKVGGRDGGLVMEAGAADELDGDGKKRGRPGKFEALFTASFLGARTDVTRAQAGRACLSLFCGQSQRAG
jgi:hypothetical protein